MGTSDVNPALAHSDLPHGLPDFASISDDDFLPAFREAMSSQRAEVEKIADDPDAPTFANTIEALELSGRDLARASGIFFNLVGPDTNPKRNEISQELSTLLTDHANAIAMNPRLFARISTLHAHADDLDLTEPQRRLLDSRYREAIRAGAGLDDAGQEEMRTISSRLAYLTTTFSQMVLDDTNDSAVLVSDEADVQGMSRGAIASARRAAADAGHDSGYLVSLELPTSQSVVSELHDAATRRRVFDASVGRCSRGNEFDTRETVLEIVRLRARRAELLGYRDHAEYVIAEQTAPDPAAVDDLLGELVTAAMRAGSTELASLTEFAHADDPDAEITASDYTYWLARQRKSSSEIDLDGFADYCELDTVITDGVFYAAGQLYGLSFRERADLHAYHPDVRIWEVFDERGTSIGLFLGDYFARPSKRGGAWMNNIVDQSTVLSAQPIIVNVLNVPKPDEGSPALLSIDQLTTLFHEFGHALHGLLSTVDYPSQSGTSVPRDFVEFPSQVNEMWALHPDVLAHYARHHETGAPIPSELADAARANAGADTAHGTIEYLAASVLDLAWHRLSTAQADDIDDVEAFEADALREAGIGTELIPPRYRTAYFNHIFGGGYSAGYYSYIWSEVLDAETEQWFLAEGGLRRENGKRFADSTLSRGDSVDPLAAHEKLIGRKPEVEPLMRRRGLVAAS
ncbi:M3 family metallopeptidase [Gordonia otitidis]|uniref:Peptidyl-dipeptidase Dcp n=1 Tax=Gordonia otitidis (strain DSM 44809 / CCUG 52243 / JCM 12355 / NBRC 100426 / IFM 10032) TaxID=1108044 RepID=H5TQP8_GORO1|nr:M3 family metallopeptidase [Gordonia otitidis]GAB35806.1 peptidyl-dipeptidase Dcp [Gordonia otitidis NBRC 100426]